MVEELNGVQFDSSQIASAREKLSLLNFTLHEELNGVQFDSSQIASAREKLMLALILRSAQHCPLQGTFAPTVTGL